MKRIIYSTIAALVLSIILALLVPRWLFRGDARWTYQNDAARVDVSFSGHLKNGSVRTEGTDLQISQPTWLSNESYQGTVIEFPVTYRTKSYQIKLIPHADEWGEDAVLVMEFRGKDFQHRGKRRTAWVSFRNIAIDGQPEAGEKLVWHDHAFVLKCPLHASEITLTFDVQKPLAASDISFKNSLAVFFACLVLCLFFTAPRTAESRISRMSNGIARWDVVKSLASAYMRVDPVYRRSFWIIFGVLCLAFGFHTICFMWGNHDWELLDNKHRWLEMAWMGRYMQYSVKALLSGGVYLPLIYDLTTYMVLALNAVLLCRYWRLEKRVTYYVLCGLVLTAQPFTLSMMYYVNMPPEVFIGVTCALVALLVSEKVASAGVSGTKKIIYSLIAIVLINFALAVYPVLMNTIAVAFVGRLLIQSFDWSGSWRQLKSYIRSFMISAALIALGIVSYKLVLTFVFPVQSFYNTDTLPLAQVPDRISALFKQCFCQLYEYKFPFISQGILWVFLGFTFILAFHICVTGNFRQRFLRLFLLFGSLFATQTAMLIAKTHLIAGRVEFFGLVIFEVLATVMIFSRFRKLHSLWVITGTCAVFASILKDLDCLRIWKLGFDAEKMLWNRILTRLEIQPDFDLNKTYQIVQIGWPISMRNRYYTEQRNMKMWEMHDSGNSLLSFGYDAAWTLFRAPEFYYPVRFRNIEKGEPDVGEPDYAQLKRLWQAGVLQKAEVWPKKNGLIVWEDIILFVTDEEELKRFRSQLERELGQCAS